MVKADVIRQWDELLPFDRDGVGEGALGGTEDALARFEGAAGRNGRRAGDATGEFSA